SGRIHVVASLAGDNPSTKTAVAAIRELTARRRVLVVVEPTDNVTIKSLRNAELVEVITFDQLNTYDVIRADDLVFIESAFNEFVKARAVEGGETIKLSKAKTQEAGK
ncbi:MAG: 50S ribosomal protein L4, partial [Actinomycetales bacterium]|nr:50S ribosomal protein L4 [Actinomycetales bacterium]